MTPTVESFWENLASQLRNFIRSRVRDHSAAEDILQEVAGPEAGADGQAARTFYLGREIPGATRSHSLEGTVVRLLSVRIGPTRQGIGGAAAAKEMRRFVLRNMRHARTVRVVSSTLQQASPQPLSSAP